MTGRPLVPLLFLASLTACAGSAQPSHQDQATISACRQRADAIYEKQNRGEVFFPNSQTDSPFSSSGAPSVTTAGLSQLKARDDTINDCIRGSAANAGSASTSGGPASPATNPLYNPNLNR